MSMTEERWADEEAWWTMGAAEAGLRAHPSCVAVLDGRLLQGADMLGAIDAWGAWDSVQMTDRRMAEGEDCVVLAYAAVARRDDGSDFAALCTSTWVRQGDDWQIVQHHRTARED